MQSQEAMELEQRLKVHRRQKALAAMDRREVGGVLQVFKDFKGFLECGGACGWLPKRFRARRTSECGI